MTNNQIYMQLAIQKAWKYQGLTYPNPAVGALIVYKNDIIAVEAHQKAGSSHAEVLALVTAYETIHQKTVDFDKFNSHKAHEFLYALPEGFFSEIIMYVTLEPCSHIGKTPSCASLLTKIKPKKVVIAMLDPIKGHDGGVQKLLEHGIEVEVDICHEEAKELLEPFMIWQKRAFVLFKIAQTSNGKIGGGYLSSKDSLVHVHQLRAVCSEMLIGGNTVREDRPTLDCRFTGDKAPNIKIYARENNFDRDIPLFGVEDREVHISNDLDFTKPSFILVEGGGGMLSVLKDRIDWILQYQTPKLSAHISSYDAEVTLKFLFQDKKGIDLMLWSKIYNPVL
ncbi:MAG: Diaminohydroxyphosphoribosylaminopyrimidine deaminase (EC / 5-amino-6-(5-phosphoribosylamino)uracil reductase (EC [uncultured Sulfurovum sp.]|uniref:Diaminohydroxyphosphoribosylaminopyrimidine deaminase uracil reductase (EC)) n=1 Tax=uncultured Sulfurovum sp. TaxID=269237 RepID=A0A6S6T7K3_9BACT|nr:MAG: Diaminohydroxyphosphoribosylaminopyrimidine deaminase (EC / 5-amino-6-(5-phosphoribosylamino)uracil reductase (EC [uncultured Sulfurovum sp.]